MKRTKTFVSMFLALMLVVGLRSRSFASTSDLKYVFSGELDPTKQRATVYVSISNPTSTAVEVRNCYAYIKVPSETQLSKSECTFTDGGFVELSELEEYVTVRGLEHATTIDAQGSIRIATVVFSTNSPSVKQLTIEPYQDEDNKFSVTSAEKYDITHVNIPEKVVLTESSTSPSGDPQNPSGGSNTPSSGDPQNPSGGSNTPSSGDTQDTNAGYDKLTDAQKLVQANATGDIVSVYLTSFFIITILLFAAYMLIKREKRSE